MAAATIAGALLDHKSRPRTIGRWLDPYNPNLLKGDYPLATLGEEDIFIAGTMVSDTILQKRDGGLFQEEDGVVKDKQSADYLITENLFLRGELFWGDTVFQQRRLSLTVGQRYISIDDRGRPDENFDPARQNFPRNVPDQEVFINTFDILDGLKNIKVVDADGNVNKSEVKDFEVDEAFLEAPALGRGLLLQLCFALYRQTFHSDRSSGADFRGFRQRRFLKREPLARSSASPDRLRHA